jgi:hypothetical protein
MKVLMSSLCIDDDRLKVDCCAGDSTKSTPDHSLHDCSQYRGDAMGFSMGIELWEGSHVGGIYRGNMGVLAAEIIR